MKVTYRLKIYLVWEMNKMHRKNQLVVKTYILCVNEPIVNLIKKISFYFEKVLWTLNALFQRKKKYRGPNFYKKSIVDEREKNEVKSSGQ